MMPSPFTLIGESWQFSQKQTVLFPVTIWLLALPEIGATLLMKLLPEQADPALWSGNTTILAALGIGVMWLLFTWGMCCVLVVGRRLLKLKVGRTRTSFRAVRTQAMRSMLPLILTGILQMCFTILWSVLLIIPGIIYSLRTSLYTVAVACEGITYREALNRSKSLIDQHLFASFLTIITLNLLLFTPIMMLEIGGANLVPADDMIPSLLLTIFTAGLRAIATLLSLLSMVSLYAYLRSQKPKSEQIIPGDIDPED